MFLLKLSKLHSYVDIITNSSTVIYTWYDSSVNKAKELLSTIAKVFGEEIDVEKEFDIFVIPEDFEHDDFLVWLDDYEYKATVPKEAIDDWDFTWNIFKNIQQGKAAPSWFMEFLSSLDSENGSNDIMIVAKNEKYEELTKKMKEFLYSSESEEAYN